MRDLGGAAHRASSAAAPVSRRPDRHTIRSLLVVAAGVSLLGVVLFP